jgi:hypothetical protein
MSLTHYPASAFPEETVGASSPACPWSAGGPFAKRSASLDSIRPWKTAEGSDPDRDSYLLEGVVDRGPCCRLGRGHDADRDLGDGRVDEADPGDRDLDERLWIAG